MNSSLAAGDENTRAWRGEPSRPFSKLPAAALVTATRAVEFSRNEEKLFLTGFTGSLGLFTAHMPEACGQGIQSRVARDGRTTSSIADRRLVPSWRVSGTPRKDPVNPVSLSFVFEYFQNYRQSTCFVKELSFLTGSYRLYPRDRLCSKRACSASGFVKRGLTR